MSRQLAQAMENIALADAQGRELFSQGVNEDDIARIYSQVDLSLPGIDVLYCYLNSMDNPTRHALIERRHHYLFYMYECCSQTFKIETVQNCFVPCCYFYTYVLSYLPGLGYRF